MSDTLCILDLLDDSRMRFGDSLRDICEVAGLTQSELSKRAKVELKQLVSKDGKTPRDSMEQPAISKVMAGLQEPTYIQVYIWLRVIRAWYESPILAHLCAAQEVDVPTFSPELERKLWRLAAFVPPDELCPL